MLSVVEPGFDDFRKKFDIADGDLKHQMQLLKLACLANPISPEENSSNT
jgi:hypothetical protein